MQTHPPEDDALALPPGHIVNHYRIIRVIGRGGFGITYAAEDIHTTTELAIKELLPSSIATRSTNHSVVAQSSSLQEDFKWAIESFIKEAQTLTKFNHPHLVRMLEFFEQNGTAYMVMPYIKGDDLKTRVRKHGALPEAQALSLLQSLMGALTCIHQAGILHRDIKPENIILQEPNYHPMLLDFGSSRNLVAVKSQAMTSIISPGYAPIEQYSTDAQYQGPWSDIYALASVIYFSVTGHAPPEAPERNNAVRHGQPDPCTPLHLNKKCKVSAKFSNAIVHGMQLSERDRPRSIQTWMSSFQQITSTAAGPVTQSTPATPVAHQPQPTNQRPAEHPTSPPLYPSRVQTRKSKRPVAVLAIIGVLIISLLSLGGFLGYEHFNKSKKKTRSTASSDRPASGSSSIATVHGGSSSGDAPVKSKPQLTSDQVRRFVSDYYKAGEAGEQLDYYASRVDYFGKSSCTLAEIDRDGIDYRRRWPKRTYAPESTIEVKGYANGYFHTTTRLGYTVNNSVEYRRGTVKSLVTVRSINGQPKITAVSNSTLVTATVTFDAKAQERSAKQFISRFIASGNSSQGSILNQLGYFSSSVSPYYRVNSANQSYIRSDLLGYANKFPTREYRITEDLRVKGAGKETITVFATVSFMTRNSTTRRGNIFNTYEVTYQGGQPKITSVTSDAIE